MEISVMVTELKNESVAIARALRVKQDESSELHDKIHKLDAEIQAMADRYDAIKMAIESLELVTPVAHKLADKQEEAPVDTVLPVKKIRRPRTALRVVKRDSKGNLIGEFSSLNKAAKSFGWSHPSMRKYIECTSREKQIRLRGYYLEFATV